MLLILGQISCPENLKNTVKGTSLHWKKIVKSIPQLHGTKETGRYLWLGGSEEKKVR